MPNKIFLYSGTGNSVWISRKIAESLKPVDLLLMDQHAIASIGGHNDSIGLVFPVHIWGLPHRVIEFVRQLRPTMADYFYAVAVNAGQVAATLLQLKKILKKQNVKLSAGISVKLPSNYIPWGGPGSIADQKKRFDLGQLKVAKLVPIIQGKEVAEIEKGPIWQNVLFSMIYKISFPHISKMDRDFWVDDKCNQCRICEKICPSGNIVLANSKPLWHQKCEQCFSCLNWCPQNAIQFGKNTPKYPRYHHPAIKINEMLDFARQMKKNMP